MNEDEMVEEKLINVTRNGDLALEVSKKMSSETRLRILILLGNGQRLNISQIAKRLGGTEANASAQVKKLVAAGLLVARYEPGRHGVQKFVSLACKRITFKFV